MPVDCCVYACWCVPVQSVLAQTSRPWHSKQCFGPFALFDLHGKEDVPEGSASIVNRWEPTHNPLHVSGSGPAWCFVSCVALRNRNSTLWFCCGWSLQQRLAPVWVRVVQSMCWSDAGWCDGLSGCCCCCCWHGCGLLCCRAEAEFVLCLYKHMLGQVTELQDGTASVAVISPYKAQVGRAVHLHVAGVWACRPA